MSKIQTVRDLRLQKLRADAAAEARDIKRQGETVEQAIARAIAMGPEYGVVVRNGRPVIYSCAAV